MTTSAPSYTINVTVFYIVHGQTLRWESTGSEQRAEAMTRYLETYHRAEFGDGFVPLWSVIPDGPHRHPSPEDIAAVIDRNFIAQDARDRWAIEHMLLRCDDCWRVMLESLHYVTQAPSASSSTQQGGRRDTEGG